MRTPRDPEGSNGNIDAGVGVGEQHFFVEGITKVAYQVLARKWRPQNFSELVGQEQVLAALVHSLNQDHLHHAYLFTGTRGVGKTTVARILAKCLNCEKGVSATPCETCDTCREIREGRFVDLIEIDAASRTKVEDTREILDNIQYAPSKGRFKVYLIDEVHMLSAHSFNALLKTLEEPPAHVKFLLATTDPQKLPITVLSRCLQFHLKHIPHELIIDRLAFILEEEKIAFEQDALPLIAKAAEGSLRDALSLLDQAISQGEGQVKMDETAKMLGLTNMETLYQLAHAIATQNSNTLLDVILQLETSPIDYAALLGLLTELWYEVSFKQNFAQYESAAWTMSHLTELARIASPTMVQLYYQMGLQGKKDLPFSPAPRIGFNMTLLRMMAFSPVTTTFTPPPQPSSTREEGDTKQRLSMSEGPTDWATLTATLPVAGMAKQLIRHMSLEKREGNTLFLSLSADHQSLLNAKLTERLTEALAAHYQLPISLQISIAGTPLNTPAIEKQRETETAQQQLQDKLDLDPHLDFIKNNFNATLSPLQST